MARGKTRKGTTLQRGRGETATGHHTPVVNKNPEPGPNQEPWGREALGTQTGTHRHGYGEPQGQAQAGPTTNNGETHTFAALYSVPIPITALHCNGPPLPGFIPGPF
jgi:hypothetical protein